MPAGLPIAVISAPVLIPSELPINAVLTVLSISKAYSKEILEDACKRALDTYSIPHYKQILEMLKMKNNEPKQKPTKDNESLNVLFRRKATDGSHR